MIDETEKLYDWLCANFHWSRHRENIRYEFHNWEIHIRIDFDYAASTAALFLDGEFVAECNSPEAVMGIVLNFRTYIPNERNES